VTILAKFLARPSKEHESVTPAERREFLLALDQALQGAEIATHASARFLAELAHGVRPSQQDISEKRAACRTYLLYLAERRREIHETLKAGT
jgi:hypothetical protein